MGIGIERVEWDPDDGADRLFVDAMPGSVKLSLDMASLSLGPAEQANRVRRMITRLEERGDQPASSQDFSLILDDFWNAAVALKHFHEWVEDAAEEEGKRHEMEQLNTTDEGRVLTDIANASKHLTLTSRKTTGRIQLEAEAEVGTPASEYVESFVVRCEGQSWNALELLWTQYEKWVKFIEEELDMSMEYVLRDDATEAFAGLLEERLERQLNVMFASTRVVDIEADDGDLTLVLAGDHVPLPAHESEEHQLRIALEAIRAVHDRGEFTDTEVLLALDGFIVAMEELSQVPGISDVLDETLAWWQELRDRELEKRETEQA